MSDPRPQLNYEPSATDWLQTRRRRRWETIALIAIAIALAGMAFPTARQRYERYQEKRACMAQQRPWMSYTAPADQVVYEEDAVAGEALLASSPSTYFRPRDCRSSVSHVPAVLRTFTGDTHDGTVFLHERRSVAGNLGLIKVDIRVIADGASQSIYLLADAIQPETADRRFDETGHPGTLFPITSGMLPTGARLRLYAGQPDPIDASRFTIRYILQGASPRSGTIDGVVQQNNMVDLNVRDAALAKQLAWKHPDPMRTDLMGND